LNEGVRPDLVDSSGNGHHGRWVPELADVKTTTGLIAGSDSAVSLPSGQFAVGKIPAAAMPSLKGQSIEFWVKIDKPPKPLDVPLELSAEMWSSLLFGGGVNIRVWAATSAYPGAVDFIIGDDASLMTAHLAIATTAFADTYWYYNICDGRPHHVVCTINAAANLLCIYVDGIDRAPFNNFVGTIASISAFAPIDINASPGWDGSCVMDELAFYNTELSATQVATHYAAGAVPWRGDTTGERIGRALTLIGWPASLTDLDDGQSVLGTFTGAGEKALDVPRRGHGHRAGPDRRGALTTAAASSFGTGRAGSPRPARRRSSRRSPIRPPTSRPASPTAASTWPPTTSRRRIR
jgi:hypothetical protein